MWHKTKRWLYLIHRWIGIATCLLFVMWFASGLVMLYVPFPSLEADERLQGQAPIAWERVSADPAAFPSLADRQDARQVVLEMRGDRPVWRVSGWDGSEKARWADTGVPAGASSRAEARQIAESFAAAPVSAMRLIQTNQWVVPGSYDRHRPLWQAELAGAGGQVLYISSTTGEVVLDTNRRERFWNWFGSVPHWLYPRALREDQPLWRQVVMWSSGPCILVALTGTWIGLMRLRAGSRRFKGGRMTPYRGWMKWHHVSGLVGAVFLILWIFSGWLSVDPWRLFASEGIGEEARRAYAGAAPLPVADIERLADAAPNARRVVIASAAGRVFLKADTIAASSLLDATTMTRLQPDRGVLLRAAARTVPDASITQVTLLTRPDAYWYSVRGNASLPVLRVKFNDAAQTWLHINPASSEILGEADSRRRTYRWLFDLFHRWDLSLLLQSHPSRDLLIWLMSLAGLISSATAVYVGWKRLRRAKSTAA